MGTFWKKPLGDDEFLIPQAVDSALAAMDVHIRANMGEERLLQDERDAKFLWASHHCKGGNQLSDAASQIEGLDREMHLRQSEAAWAREMSHRLRIFRVNLENGGISLLEEVMRRVSIPSFDLRTHLQQLSRREKPAVPRLLENINNVLSIPPDGSSRNK